MAHESKLYSHSCSPLFKSKASSCWKTSWKEESPGLERNARLPTMARKFKFVQKLRAIYSFYMWYTYNPMCQDNFFDLKG